jgi:hypothetical protein
VFADDCREVALAPAAPSDATPPPGRWTVRVSEGNRGALLFWTDVVTEFTNGAAVETVRPGHPSAWRVFSFESGRGT